MSPLVINVNECSLYIGENLYLVLKLLAEVVRFPKGSTPVHYHINLDEIVLCPVN